MTIALIGSIIFSLVVILYVLLSFGYPYGEYAMGGKYKIMPMKLRVACAISVLIQLFAIIILLQTADLIPYLFSRNVTVGICYFFAAYLTLNTVMNGISRSKKEQLVMTPLALITAICFWMTAVNA